MMKKHPILITIFGWITLYIYFFYYFYKTNKLTYKYIRKINISENKYLTNFIDYGWFPPFFPSLCFFLFPPVIRPLTSGGMGEVQ